MAVPAAAVPPPARDVDRLFEFSLLGMLASGYLAVLGSGFLDLPTAAVMALALIARALVVGGVLRIDIPPRVVTVATLLYIGFYPLDYLFVSRQFMPATVHLVFFLAATKLLTARSERDYHFVRIVAFLELLVAAIVSGSLNFFLFLALFLVFAVMTFSSGEIRRSSRKPVRLVRSGLRSIHWRVVAMTLFAATGILALTGGMFFVLPRTARAAFQRFVPERYHLPGFSNEVTLGQLGEVKTRSETVMRVRDIAAGRGGPHSMFVEMPATLKWRGNALSAFDGRRWYNPEPVRRDRVNVQVSLTQLIPDERRPAQGVPRIMYEVHVQNIATDVLFFPGVPEFVTLNAPYIWRLPTDSYKISTPPLTALAYQASSYLVPPGGLTPSKPLTPAERAQYLQLPAVDGRVASLAREWAAGARTPFDTARAIETRLRNDFRYTLQQPSKLAADPLAEFLLSRRAGHCEYFASAMAVLLRTAGIPSRVVTGFQSGVYNPVSGWVVIKASDAHSWVEAYLPNRGWTTYDPTPPDPNAARTGLWTRIGFYLDAAETFWQEWILNYNLDRQLLLALKMQETTRSPGAGWMDGAGAWFETVRDAGSLFLKRWGATVAMVLIATALLICFGPRLNATWTARRRVMRAQQGQAIASDATLLYSRMLTVLSRKGIEKPAWTTPLEFARALPASDLSPVVEDLTAAYNDVRYGGRPDAAARMVVLLDRLQHM